MLSSFEVTEGAYFYEIEILQNIFHDKIQTGWITKFTKTDILHYNNNSLLNDDRSLVFCLPNAQSGDIISCYVNVEQQINIFFNGQHVIAGYNHNILKNLPIFSLTIVEFGQKIQVNFGNKAFKYPPNKHYKTFYSMAVIKSPSFQINIKHDIEWFCRMEEAKKDFKKRSLQVFDFNQKKTKNLFRFNDLMQKQFDEKVTGIEIMINANNNLEDIAFYLFSVFENLDNKDAFWDYRFLQSIVETIGTTTDINKLNKLDQCVFLILENKYFDNFSYHIFFINYIFVFLQTINFQNNSYKNQTKIHYICLILSYFFENCPCCEYLKEQCELFFYNVLNHSTNPWCQYYSFKSLNKFETFQTKLKQYLLNAFSKNEKLPFFIWKNNWENIASQIALKKTIVKESLAQKLVTLQLYQYLQHYLPETSQTTNDNASKKGFGFEVLDKTKFLFSRGNLMIRSDHFYNYSYDNYNFKTIRYNFVINPPSFYFEVTIITEGLMRIGLAVNKMYIGRAIGDNQFSIGIDGYSRCVWMNDEKYKFKAFCPEWNGGDKIGIYVDFVNRFVIFGFNNKIIELDGDPFEEKFIFSKLPCHVAASLWQYQQCFFNFDCKEVPQAFLNKLETINQNQKPKTIKKFTVLKKTDNTNFSAYKTLNGKI